jgi:hypothetical protein
MMISLLLGFDRCCELYQKDKKDVLDGMEAKADSMNRNCPLPAADNLELMQVAFERSDRS